MPSRSTSLWSLLRVSKRGAGRQRVRGGRSQWPARVWAASGRTAARRGPLRRGASARRVATPVWHRAAAAACRGGPRRRGTAGMARNPRAAQRCERRSAALLAAAAAEACARTSFLLLSQHTLPERVEKSDSTYVIFILPVQVGQHLTLRYGVVHAEAVGGFGAFAAPRWAAVRRVRRCVCRARSDTFRDAGRRGSRVAQRVHRRRAGEQAARPGAGQAGGGGGACGVPRRECAPATAARPAGGRQALGQQPPRQPRARWLVPRVAAPPRRIAGRPSAARPAPTWLGQGLGGTASDALLAQACTACRAASAS